MHGCSASCMHACEVVQDRLIDRLTVVICAGHIEPALYPKSSVMTDRINRCDIISIAAGSQWILHADWVVC